MSFSVCCLNPLPVVRQAGEPGHFSEAVSPLLDSLLPELSQAKVDVLKSRFCAVVDSADRESARNGWWDSRLFILGFGGSLMVTVAASVGQAGYMTPHAMTAVNSALLLLSTAATAALGLREKLRFKESAEVSRKLSSHLQRAFFLFLAKAGKYASTDGDTRFRMFVADVETLKLRSDQEQAAAHEGGHQQRPPHVPTPLPLPDTPGAFAENSGAFTAFSV